jgi:outer membrane immunogenic protein
MKRHYAGLLALTLSGVAALAAANAADISGGPGGYKDAPYAYDWSGIYVGGNGGGGWSDPSWNFPVNSFYLTNAPRSFSTDLSGGLGGGQIGINKQFGSYVVGVEVTGDWSNWTQTKVGPLDPNFPKDKWTAKLEDLETFSLRFGYAMNTWLLYGKVGGALGNVSLSAVSGPPGAGVTFSQSRQLWGNEFGGGAEYALTPNIIVGAEYNYVALNGSEFNGGASNGSHVTVLGSEVAVQTVTGRISYKFGSVYDPLK